jgi:hypothetical protein
MESKSAVGNRAAAPGTFAFAWTRIRTSQFWIVAVAFLLRIAWIILGHTYKFKSADNNFGFGWEMGRIGASLASGHGFSSPFDAPTGPTAWEPPLYPYLTAGVFFIFGIYSKASAFVLLALNSFFSALTCIPIFLIARRIFSEKVAVGSAWAWALLPNVMYWCTKWVWETSLSALLLAVLFWLALSMEDRDGWWPWVRFGVLWGVAALNSTVLIAFLPGAGLWVLYRSYKTPTSPKITSPKIIEKWGIPRTSHGKQSIAGVVLASIAFSAVLTPWLVRNYETFGQCIFIRDNFGAELRLGNGPGADGTWMEYLHPAQNAEALREYAAMGELNYIAMRKRQAIDYIRADYARFARLCVKRFIYYWAAPPKATRPAWISPVKNSLFLASSALMFWGLGRALRLRKPGAWLLFWLMLLYPAVYYVVFPSPRYRVPIEPEMTILCVYVITEAKRKSGRVSTDPARDQFSAHGSG